MTREEAIKQIREWDFINEDDMEILATLIPELRESEDERIREIITDSVFYLYGAGVEYKDVLDYLDKLEKRKEQKPAQSDDEKEYVRTLKGLVSDFIRNTGGGITDVSYYQRICGWLDGRHIEQKPAEWSDTNELVFKDICKHLKEEGLNGWIVVLEALHNGEFKSKQEWSEEDEKMRNLAIEWAETMSGQFSFVDMDSTDFCKIISWLKSLRPSWKPSEEQMKALLNAEGFLRAGLQHDSAKTIAELYEHLKKL